MEPAWERHDFAIYAAGLPGVRRLVRAHRVLLVCALVCAGIPLLIAATGGSIALVALTPLISVTFSVASAVCVHRAAMVERLAIARWVIAGERAQQMNSSPSSTPSSPHGSLTTGVMPVLGLESQPSPPGPTKRTDSGHGA